jgi:hypothetical protein
MKKYTVWENEKLREITESEARKIAETNISHKKSLKDGRQAWPPILPIGSIGSVEFWKTSPEEFISSL